jgi:alkanesulfonate monooxygenase SsuD/methylene tetrahydromethanopterin reductase-like flavin-dependent oxidoreductase (luciferase family)
MASLGVVFLPYVEPTLLKPVAVAADEAGLEELWLWEDCFRQGGISAAAAALAWTDHLTVGIGILPMPLRNVALLAMEISGIERLFPGRLRTGVGHGVLDWMGQVGNRAASPLTLMREYVTALKRLLAGEEVTTQGRYVSLDRVQLGWPPENPVPVVAAGEGPKTLRLVGEVADGLVLPGNSSPDRVRHARTLVDEGRAAAGRTDEQPIVVYLMAATGADAEERLEREMRLWDVEPGPDMGVAGDADAVAAAVRRWVEAGADSVILQPTRDDPDLEGFVRFVARDVRALVP